MAVHTFKKDQLGVTQRNSDHLSTVQEKFLEGASQTFLAGALVTLTGGYIVKCADVPAAGSIFGVAVEDAHNGTAGANYVTVVRVEGTHELYGNLLLASAANHTLVITNLGANADLDYDANLLGTGIGGYYVQTPAAAAGMCEIVSFRGDQVPSPAGRLPTNEAQVGDINPRVRVRILPTYLSPA